MTKNSIQKFKYLENTTFFGRWGSAFKQLWFVVLFAHGAKMSRHMLFVFQNAAKAYVEHVLNSFVLPGMPLVTSKNPECFTTVQPSSSCQIVEEYRCDSLVSVFCWCHADQTVQSYLDTQ